ncbi:hypothetical protein EGT07_25665 [Herbaspirillum sp. HC18]|nr:hypothetical protein EGT07_25665 [Herbaspirillum sp. HC18]
MLVQEQRVASGVWLKNGGRENGLNRCCEMRYQAIDISGINGLFLDQRRDLRVAGSLAEVVFVVFVRRLRSGYIMAAVHVMSVGCGSIGRMVRRFIRDAPMDNADKQRKKTPHQHECGNRAKAAAVSHNTHASVGE